MHSFAVSVALPALLCSYFVSHSHALQPIVSVLFLLTRTSPYIEPNNSSLLCLFPTVSPPPLLFGPVSPTFSTASSFTYFLPGSATAPLLFRRVDLVMASILLIWGLISTVSFSPPTFYGCLSFFLYVCPPCYSVPIRSFSPPRCPRSCHCFCQVFPFYLRPKRFPLWAFSSSSFLPEVFLALMPPSSFPRFVVA